MARTKGSYSIVYVGQSGALMVEMFEDTGELKTRLRDLESQVVKLFGGSPISFGTEIVIGTKPAKPKAERKPRKAKDANGGAVGKAADATGVA